MNVHRFLRSAFFAVVLLGLAGISFAQFEVSISIGVAPPPLPVYDQPPLPEAGYVWTPGYWSWGDDGYYWVPGTWVQPPEAGLLWTPGYWGWNDEIRPMIGMTGIGLTTSDTTAASTTVMAILATVITVDAGRETTSTTTTR